MMLFHGSATGVEVGDGPASNERQRLFTGNCAQVAPTTHT